MKKNKIEKLDFDAKLALFKKELGELLEKYNAYIEYKDLHPEKKGAERCLADSEMVVSFGLSDDRRGWLDYECIGPMSFAKPLPVCYPCMCDQDE